MDPRLLFVTAITLLYKENQLRDPSCNSSELVKEVVGAIRLPETSIDFDRSREIIQGLRATVLWMCDNQNAAPYDRATFLQRIRINASDDEPLYAAVEQGLEAASSAEELKRQCLQMRRELQLFLNQTRIKDIVKKYSAQIFYRPEDVDWKTLVPKMIEELEPLQSMGEKGKMVGMVEEVDLFDQQSVGVILARTQEEMKGLGIFRTGYQAINRMLGDVGGIRRGDAVVVGALQHNFKTGFVMELFKHAAIYNKPYMKDPSKKPLLLHVSFENELKDNILWLYANIRENETGQECDLSTVDVGYAQEYIYNAMSVNGFHIKMARMNPSEVTYRDFQNYILALEAEGYEVQLIALDYASMMSKTGLASDAIGQNIRDLWRRLRNFTSSRSCALISPHQLSTEAKMLVRQGMGEEFVKEIANKGYYDGCRTLDQEVDLELYIHIVVKNGKSYLCVQRGKHRKPKPTPHHHLYTVLPFDPVGAIPDDLNGRDRSVKAPGAGADGSGDDAWWVTQQPAAPQFQQFGG